jgi:PAS domain S-box-containing protein
VLTWSSGAARIKGYAANDVVGKSFEMFYLPADVISGVPTEELEIAERYGSFQGDGWRLRADGRRFRAYTSLSAIREPGGALTGFARVTHDLTRRAPGTKAAGGTDRTDTGASRNRNAATSEPGLVRTLSMLALKPVLDVVATGYFTLDRDWRFSTVSTGAALLFGKPASLLVGRPLVDQADDPARANFLVTLPERIGSAGKTEFIGYHAHGGRWILVQAFSEHEQLGTMVLLHDVTDEIELGVRTRRR